MCKDLAKYAKDNGVKYFLISFVDLFGGQRAKLVPAAGDRDMQKDGAGFAGFAVWLDLTPAHPDMLAVPDPARSSSCPGSRRSPGRGDLPDGRQAGRAQAPRNTLKRQSPKAASKAFVVKTGVEPEFFLTARRTAQISDEYDTAGKILLRPAGVMRRFDVIAVDLRRHGRARLGPYQNDHEDANGQFEMNWATTTRWQTADKHSFFKFMVKSIAEQARPARHLHAEAVPGADRQRLPRPHLGVGSKPARTNAFADKNMELGLSEQGRHFLGGIMKRPRRSAAIFNPTVNSYKRINAPRTVSGATWAPNTVTWTGNNRTHMVRVPGPAASSCVCPTAPPIPT
jgi:glutamine synthetase